MKTHFLVSVVAIAGVVIAFQNCSSARFSAMDASGGISDKTGFVAAVNNQGMISDGADLPSSMTGGATMTDSQNGTSTPAGVVPPPAPQTPSQTGATASPTAPTEPVAPAAPNEYCQSGLQS